jgi:flagellar basal body rod protein FlgG
MSELIPQVSSSINALMREYETITNNLANVSTAGYKRRCNSFTQLLEGQMKGSGNSRRRRIQLNSSLDFSQGNLSKTGRPLDFAIYGKGFFVIETPQGPLYTRNGVFHTNQNGQIVDSEDRIVAGETGPITIPANAGISEVSVSQDGNISAGGTPIGRFRIVDFEDNEDKLVPAGNSCYRMPDKQIQPVEADEVSIRQGAQEVSNVKMIEELVDMLMVTRLYEANMKFIAARKQISSSITNAAMA